MTDRRSRLARSSALALSSIATLALSLAACDQGTGVGGRRPDAASGGDIDAALVAGEDAASPMEEDAALPPGPRENCANSEDDTGEGYVDEGCTCPSVGEWQYCWPGDPGRRNVGACRDGVQYCVEFGEFLSWDLCNGAVLPRPEIEGNGIDEDCDGNDPGGSTTCGEFEDCGPNGLDEDCDGLADCNDPDCAMQPGCASSCMPTETSCADGLDDDCDGFVDCADTSCGSAEECEPPPPPPPGCTREFPFFVEIRCTDMRDNDCDTYIDCADSDCRSPGNCGCAARETACSDGVDEDCDGDVDCGDTDCQRCVPGQRRWCDDPTYCHWGIQDCNADGSWGACIETTERPGDCSGSIYSRDCCVDAGECCENYPTDRTSVGTCTGIVSCL